MHVTRHAEAPAYDAPGHDRMAMRRLQGRDAGPSSTMWLGLSVLAPGGGTTLDTSDQEKMYVVLEGEVTMISDTGEAVLQPLDSCRFAPGEGRQLANRSDRPATVLLAMSIGHVP